MSPELSPDEPKRGRDKIITDNLNVIQDKLSDIISRLERIEERQIKTTAMVQDVEKQEQKQVTGSFGGSQIPEDK